MLMSAPGDDIIRLLRKCCSNPSRSCKEKGCRLNLEELSTYVVERAESPLSDEAMCDCIVFARKDFRYVLAIVELKSKSVHIREVVTQLQNGVTRAANILSGLADRKSGWEVYILCLAREWHTSVSKLLASHRVYLKGRRLPNYTEEVRPPIGTAYREYCTGPHIQGRPLGTAPIALAVQSFPGPVSHSWALAQ